MYADAILTTYLADTLGVGFDLGGLDEARASFRSAVTDRVLSDDAIDLYDDILLLDTAELSLVVELALERVPQRTTVKLTRGLFLTAAEKMTCPTYVCPLRLRTSPQLADVIPFFGDALKAIDELGSLSYRGWHQVRAQPQFWADAVQRTEATYREMTNVGRYAGLAESGYLRVQGALWAMKATLLFQSPRVEDSDDLRTAVTQYIASLSS